MKLKRFYISLTISFFLVVTHIALAEMTSASYKISVSVLSGGGGFTTSTSYTANGTLGQPSPLMDPGDPPFSDGYDLYPGFWYAVRAGGCPGDYYGDGDVDGLDLYDYIMDYPGVIALETFADYFGRDNCPVLP
jgi:hypothetical protein